MSWWAIGRKTKRGGFRARCIVRGLDAVVEETREGETIMPCLPVVAPKHRRFEEALLLLASDLDVAT